MYLFSDENAKISKEAPKIDFLDHGFLFGDSIYEVVRLYEGRAFAWNEHLKRLENSAKRLGFPDLAPHRDDLLRRAQNLYKSFGEKNACLRIVVTRGPGKLHIDPRTCKQPRVYMAVWKYENSFRPDSMSLYIPEIRRNARETMDPGIKSGNYLNNIMALREATAAGCEDALMLNPRDELTELTTSNIAWIRKGRIETPATQCGILHGITRQFCMKTVDVVEGHYRIEALDEIDEIFVLSTLKEIAPVREIRSSDGRTWKWSKFDQTLLIHEKLRHTIQRELEAQELIV